MYLLELWSCSFAFVSFWHIHKKCKHTCKRSRHMLWFYHCNHHTVFIHWKTIISWIFLISKHCHWLNKKREKPLIFYILSLFKHSQVREMSLCYLFHCTLSYNLCFTLLLETTQQYPGVLPPFQGGNHRVLIFVVCV